MKEMEKKHIDEEQAQTIDEHFKLIMEEGNDYIDSNCPIATPKDLPEWFDEELFKTAQNHFDRNSLTMFFAYTVGLIAVFGIPTIAKVLLFTKQSSTPCAGFKRYVTTALHIFNLHDYDPLDGNSKFYQSLYTIKKKHAITSKLSLQSKNAGITMYDMVLTQYAFLAYIVMNTEELGITNSSVEREGIVHFWRVIGYMLGIPNRLNICRKNENETTILCKKLRDEVCIKGLEQKTEEFSYLTDVALQGLRTVDPTLDSDAFMKMFYDIHEMKYEKTMGLYSRFIYNLKWGVLNCIGSPYIGWIARPFWCFYFRFIMKVAVDFPLIAWSKYGRAESKINMFPYAKST